MINKVREWAHGYKRKILLEIKRSRDIFETRRQFANQKQKRIVIGASGLFEPGWLPTEISFLNLLKPSDWSRLFVPNSADAMLAEHVWEHLTQEEGLIAAQTCYKYLKHGGYLRVAVPDGFHSDKDYIERVRVGGSGPGADDHKVMYTYITFSDLFQKAGFEVELLEYFDEHQKFHYTDWLPEQGKILRSKRFDRRNQTGRLNYTSIILDARKR